MFSILTIEPIMSEYELGVALATYKSLYYGDSQVYMPDLTDIGACLHWMAFRSNGQIYNFDIVRAIVDSDSDEKKRLESTYKRMRASAELYVQLWHYNREIQIMTGETLKSALDGIMNERGYDSLNLGRLFWAESDPPSFLRY